MPLRGLKFKKTNWGGGAQPLTYKVVLPCR